MEDLFKVNFSAQEWAKNNAKERDEFISKQILDFIDKKQDSLYIYDKRSDLKIVDGKYTIRIELYASPLRLVEDENTKLTYAIDVFAVYELMKLYKVKTPIKLFGKLYQNPVKYQTQINRIKLKEGS